ncbi:MAG TPA: inositol monophosphatase family protein [Terrimesophilobacter sp.]|nr:inositol monophosphatase family protein [Terrimesophilobacter sp.]
MAGTSTGLETTASDDLLGFATQLAQEAGELAARRRREGVTIAGSKSSLVDIVTEADREVERFIRARLAAERPDDGFLGEESGAGESVSGLIWVVDPIDGTINYAYGIPNWAVSIAVVSGDPDPARWSAITGVVFSPLLGELFTATAGGGAFLNGLPIRVAEPVELASALIGTGFGYRAEQRVQDAELLRELIGSVRDIRRHGAASLDLCGVAVGRLNAYYERGLSAWDHAAGGLIAMEAGALVQGPGGGPATEELIVAGHSSVVAALIPFLRTR